MARPKTQLAQNIALRIWYKWHVLEMVEDGKCGPFADIDEMTKLIASILEEENENNRDKVLLRTH